MCTRSYHSINNVQKGAREVRGKGKDGIKGEDLDSPLEKKTGVIGNVEGVTWI
jgi:hypothetical protein